MSILKVQNSNIGILEVSYESFSNKLLGSAEFSKILVMKIIFIN